MRLGRGWGSGLRQLGRDRQLEGEAPHSVPTTHEHPEASPCFSVHHPYSVTVRKETEGPSMQ